MDFQIFHTKTHKKFSNHPRRTTLVFPFPYEQYFQKHITKSMWPERRPNFDMRTHAQGPHWSWRRPRFVIRNECQLYFNQTASPICESAGGVASNFERRGLYVGQACCSAYTCFATKITRMSRLFSPRPTFYSSPVLHSFGTQNEACASAS